MRFVYDIIVLAQTTFVRRLVNWLGTRFEKKKCRCMYHITFGIGIPLFSSQPVDVTERFQVFEDQYKIPSKLFSNENWLRIYNMFYSDKTITYSRSQSIFYT